MRTMRAPSWRARSLASSTVGRRINGRWSSAFGFRKTVVRILSSAHSWKRIACSESSISASPATIILMISSWRTKTQRRQPMPDVQCAIEEKGVRCSTVLTVAEAVTENARFICKNHPRTVQVRAASRKYDPTRDEADSKLRLQNYQFDPDMNRAGKPIGTSHIKNQGSEILSADDIAKHLKNAGIGKISE